MSTPTCLFQDHPFQPLTHPSVRTTANAGLALVYNSERCQYCETLATFFLFRKTEGPRVELHDLAEMRQKVGQAVVASIGMILVRNIFLLQLQVQRLSAFLEAIVIVSAAVEVDSQLSQPRRILLRQNKGTIFVPMRRVNRVPKDFSQRSTQGSTRVRRSIEFLWGLRNQRGTLCTGCGEHFRMRESKT